MNTIGGQQSKEWQISNLYWISKESFNQKWQKVEAESARRLRLPKWHSGRGEEESAEAGISFSLGLIWQVPGGRSQQWVEGEKKGGRPQILTPERLCSFLPSLAGVQVACSQGDNDDLRTQAAVGQTLVTPPSMRDRPMTVAHSPKHKGD